MKAFLHFTSDICVKYFPEIFAGRFDVVSDIDDAEVVIVDGVVGLQKALAESECDVWVNLVDIGSTFTNFGGFDALVAAKKNNPRIKIYDAFGRQGCDRDPIDFVKLIKSFE
jgi:hypothetical protein